MRLFVSGALAGLLSTACYFPNTKAIRDGLVEDCHISLGMPECVYSFDSAGPCCDADWSKSERDPEGCEPEPTHEKCLDGSAPQLVEKRAWERAVRIAFQSSEEEQCLLEDVVDDLCSEEAREEAIEEGAESELLVQQLEELDDCITRERGPYQQRGDDECLFECSSDLSECGGDECDVGEIDECFNVYERCRLECV
jgi:hypothetical protein